MKRIFMLMLALTLLPLAASFAEKGQAPAEGKCKIKCDSCTEFRGKCKAARAKCGKNAAGEAACKIDQGTCKKGLTDCKCEGKCKMNCAKQKTCKDADKVEDKACAKGQEARKENSRAWWKFW